MRNDCEESIPFLKESESLVETNSETDPIARYGLASSKPKRTPDKEYHSQIATKTVSGGAACDLPNGHTLGCTVCIAAGAVLLV